MVKHTIQLTYANEIDEFVYSYCFCFVNQFEANVSLGQRLAVFSEALKEGGAAGCNRPTQCF